jgi:hypothetical protein
MNIKTAEEIAKETDHLEGRANRAAINALYRAQDESHLYPINGRFDGTERAIRKAQRYERDSGIVHFGLEYCYLIDSMLSEIVNGPCEPTYWDVYK